MGAEREQLARATSNLEDWQLTSGSGVQWAKPLPPDSLTRLGLRDPRFRPLSDVGTVLRDLGEFDIAARQVRELVESGLLIAFNISVHPNREPEWRILTGSIELLRTCGGGQPRQLEWPEIFGLIIPHAQPVVTGLEVRRSLLCDRGHVENLVLAGELAWLKKSPRGPGGSWSIARENLEAFLRRRMR
jgi:hypothetical protein